MKIIRKLNALFMNQPIRIKMLICMLFVSVFAILISTYSFYDLVFTEQIEQAKDAARIKVDAASVTMNDNLSTLISNMVDFVDKPHINTLFSKYEESNQITANSFVDCMEDLIFLSKTNSLLEAILMITPDGDYMSNPNTRMRDECASAQIWPDYGKSTINWLSARSTPYAAMDKDVIPLSFSYHYKQSPYEYIPVLVNGDESFVFRMFFFFDYQKVLALLQSDNHEELSFTYLADESFNPISVIPGSHFYPVVSSPDFIEAVQHAAHSGNKMEIAHQNDVYLLYTGTPITSGLRVINITSKNQLLLGYADIKQTILQTLFVTVAAAIFLALALSRQLSQPLKRLVESVEAIGSEKNNMFIPLYCDEIGLLGTAVNRMRNTINLQMQTIKNEERKRAKAEIRMLTQQINPHFIYNTLDCIRWEILSGNVEGSSKMVEDLASFLRLGFSQSEDTISVREETQRIRKYIDIMNQRMDAPISFFSYIDPQLNEWQIPRMVLQPLVENSIKHGFSSEVFKLSNQPREIYFRCIIQDSGYISLSVEDNGAGIDISRAEAAINLSEKDPSSQNVGLRNNYLRMRAHYGSDHIEMRFSSTPFYLNRVEYLIHPLHDPGAASFYTN